MRKLFLEVVYRHSPAEMIFWGVVAIAVWTVASLLCKKKEKIWRKWIIINEVGVVAIFVIIIKYTLIRSSTHRAASLIPFYSFIYRRSSDRYNTVTANLLLFLPLGMNLPFAISSIKTKWIRTHPVGTAIFVSLFFSIFIETAQFFFALGLCETDDVIFNTLGAVMGTLPYIIFINIRNCNK